MNMEGNMKKEKLFKNKKRGQGFAEYALLAAGLIIIVGAAVWAFGPVFNGVGNYIGCILRAVVQANGGTPAVGGCAGCLDDDNTTACAPGTGSGGN